MNPADLAQRIARMDWSMLPLQNLLAVTVACETLSAIGKAPTVTASNVVPFPVLRGCQYVPERRVALTLLDGTPFADALCARHGGAAWDWIVETVVDELRCYPEQVGIEDDTVTVDGMPCYLVG